MIFFEQYATIWEILEDKGKYARVKFSTSRKDKNNEGVYHTSYWFANFIGRAYEKVKDLDVGTRVQVKGTLDNEPFVDASGEKVYRKQPAMAIYDIELQLDKQPVGKRMDTPPRQVKTGRVTEEDLPF